jgi:hypothetical protein
MQADAFGFGVSPLAAGISAGSVIPHRPAPEAIADRWLLSRSERWAHLHKHLFPRQLGDTFAGRPLNLKERHHSCSEAELEALKAMVAPLGRGGAASLSPNEP